VPKAVGMAVATMDIIGAYCGFLFRTNGTAVCASDVTNGAICLTFAVALD
jgi:hypothetical protein